jgi:hypothetical protein
MRNFIYSFANHTRRFLRKATPSPNGEGYNIVKFILEIVGIACNFNFALVSELSDLSTTLRSAQDDGVLNLTAYIAEILIPKVEPHPSMRLRIDTFPDREGYIKELF